MSRDESLERTQIADGFTTFGLTATPRHIDLIVELRAQAFAEGALAVQAFDPVAVRALVAAVRTRLSYGVNVGLRPLVKAVEDSEKK